MSVWNRRLALGVIGPTFVGLLVFAAILLPARELSSVRFAVGAVSFLCTALGVTVLANGLTLSGNLDGRAQLPRVRQDFGRGISF
jgi:hypothetical protein